MILTIMNVEKGMLPIVQNCIMVSNYHIYIILLIFNVKQRVHGLLINPGQLICNISLGVYAQKDYFLGVFRCRMPSDQGEIFSSNFA